MGTVEGDIFCLRAATGETLWKRETTGGIYPAPATDSKKLYTGGWGGHYLGLDQETGDMDWAYYIPNGPAGESQRNVISPDSGAPVLVGDRMFASVGGSAFALDTKTGRRISFLPSTTSTGATPARGWFRSISKLERSYGNSWGRDGGSNVCFGSSSDIYFRCIAARPEAGSVPQLLWSCKLESIVEESCPAIYGNRVFFLAADGYLYALE